MGSLGAVRGNSSHPSDESGEDEGREEERLLPEIVEPETDPLLYRDTESLLFKGFVVGVSYVGDVRVVWKSVNHLEWEELILAYGDTLSQDFQDAFFRKSVYLLGGLNVLEDPASVEEILSELPPGSKGYLDDQLRYLNERAYRATRMVEAYVFEKNSRWRWVQLRGLPLNATAVTGIRGTESLGLNWAQLTWRGLNSLEDRLEEIESDWDHAKFIGSCFTKLTKIYNQDNRRKYDNKVSKIRRKEEIIRREILLVPEDQARTSSLENVSVARDATDLIREVKRSLRGAKDFHDQVIEAAEAHQRAQLQAQEEARIQMQEAVRRERGHDLPYDGGARLDVPITPEQLRDRIQTRTLRAPTGEDPSSRLEEERQRLARFGIIP